jgi:PAS domain S-box-containing protein
MFVAWGPALGFLYNDAYAEILGAKHPRALGARFQDIWAEIWPDIAPLISAALRGDAVYRENLPLTVNRRGYPEQAWFTFSYSPVRDDTGQVAGMFCACHETTRQVLAEQGLSQRSQELRLLTDALPALVAYIDADQRYRFVNKAYQDWFSVNPDDILGRTVREVIGEAAYAVVEPAIARTLSGERLTYNQLLPYAGAGRRNVEIQYVPRRDQEDRVEGYYALIQDVTQREAALAALNAREAQLRELNETLEQRVAERTAERDRAWRLSQDLLVCVAPDRAMLAFNASWSRLLGWDDSETVGREFTEFTHPDDLEETLEVFAGIFEAPLSTPYEFRLRHKDGSYRWFAWTAAFEDGRVYASGRDVTDEKARQAELAAAEAARREADALYRAYFENTAEALFVVNVLEDGGFTIEDLNPAHQASVGLPLAEVAGKRIDEILPPEAADAVQKFYRQAVAQGSVYQYREAFEHRGTTTVWDTVLVPIVDLEGRIIRLIGSSRDLTGQVAAEEALRQSQKLDAMGQLTGGVAHDFNNLLTPIIASLDMLLRRGVGSERERRLMDGALQSAERAKVLVQRLLAFARKQPLQPGPVDVRRLVIGMSELIASTLGPRIDVRVELPEELPPALADANQLEMALLNLAVNARDAMPDAGVLTISAAREAVRGPHPAKLRVGHYVRLSVQDTGVGMDEATLGRAVEPFFSTKDVGKGTGLGLSMVHGLAEQLGGGLVLTSSPGTGTTVDLWLPLSATGASESEARTAGRTTAPKARGLALLVDDEDLVRMSTADMLMDLGYEVREARSADEALRLMSEGLAPNLVVTDHLMPGMSGLELARDLRARQPDLPVLIVSGYAEMDGIAPGFARLTKPFRASEMAASLSALMSDPVE